MRYETRSPGRGLLAAALPLTIGLALLDAAALSAPPDEDAFAPVLARLEQRVASERYHGVVAVVEVAGERVVDAALGARDVASDSPMEGDEIFRIFSMTKPITATAAMILVERGELELDAPVSDYLPAFAGLQVGVEVRDPETGEAVLERVDAERPMTVRDLMRHTSGLTYGLFSNSLVDQLVVESGILELGTTAEEAVDALSRLPLKTQPGTTFEYSLASDVLGCVIQEVTGQSLGAFFDAEIFGPLGMVDTGFHVPLDDAARVATSYGRRDGRLVRVPDGELAPPHTPPGLHSGGGGLFSTADDYLRFCRMLLGDGAVGDVRVLSAESVAAMTSDQLGPIEAPWLLLGGGGFGYGMGVARGSTPEDRGAFWWGGYAGTGFWVDPETETIGVFLIQTIAELNHSQDFRRSVQRVAAEASPTTE